MTVRFVAMCQGCPFRPVTTFGLVMPALQAVQGVNEVSVEGVRVSEEAATRALLAMGADMAWPPFGYGEDDDDV